MCEDVVGWDRRWFDLGAVGAFVEWKDRRSVMREWTIYGVVFFLAGFN